MSCRVALGVRVYILCNTICELHLNDVTYFITLSRLVFKYYLCAFIGGNSVSVNLLFHVALIAFVAFLF